MTVMMGYEVLFFLFFKHVHRRWYFRRRSGADLLFAFSLPTY